MRVINSGNALPQKVVSAPSSNTFKNALDKFWEKLLIECDPKADSTIDDDLL